MKHYLSLTLLLVAAGLIVALAPRSHAPEAANAHFVVATEPDEMTVQTGDQFWGLHLEGVIECSSLLVKRGGYLVIIAPTDKIDHKSYYHVKGSKSVELAGVRFDLAVEQEDSIRVRRHHDEVLAAAVP